MKYNKTVKFVIALMLCMVLALTGITFDDTVTAGAASAAPVPITQNMSITMKPGDTKALIIVDDEGGTINKTAGYYYLDMFECTSSNEDVVTVEKDYVYTDDEQWCLVLTATGEGTATITCVNDTMWKTPIDRTTTIKVTVKLAAKKMTAKQKKCKHSYKVTKKATCQRTGIKTCKKCKWQKSIAKTAHKYKTTTITTTGAEGYYHVYYCSGGPDDDMCGFETRVKYKYGPKDKYGNEIILESGREITSDSPYKSEEDAFCALANSQSSDPSSEHYVPDGGIHASWGDYEEEWGNVTTTRKAKICKYCGKEKQ